MLPSPSLGPPLLSASWSPPLFCGIPALALAVPEPAEPEPADGAEGDGALADGERALGEEADPEEAGPEEAEGNDAAGEGLLDPPPQPAAASASAASVATRGRLTARREARRVSPAPNDGREMTHGWGRDRGFR